ncbi:hypothetical protein SteCoe_13906 [Stentor coeruleus]|uniref:Uncharacterized protein n=1 Tax=Stentor coeruleus TaxID=5963 RepID=A0A1R2C7H9_9CILI|nr:hypothetical protein SteCoe_13906 [Stentor coeruleus]
MLDLAVKHVEGLGENLSYAGCYVTVENNLVDVITPLTQASLESAIKIPSCGKLHLIIKNMREGDKLIGSVSLPISLLKESIHWLPLFDSLDYDYLQTLPEKVDCPRIQIQILNITHDYSTNFIDKVKSLQLKIMDLEHTLASERWEFQREIGSLSSSQRYREDSQALVIEQLKLQIEKQEVLIQDLLGQKNDVAKTVEKESQWKKELDDKLKSICAEYEKTLKKAQDRDLEYIATISILKKESLDLKFKYDCQQQDLYEKDLTISHLKEKNSQLSLENYEKMLETLKSKAVVYQEHMKKSEKNRDGLQLKIEELIERISAINLCPNCEANEKEIVELSNQVSFLKSELREYENKENKLSFSSLESESFKEPPVTTDLSSKILQLMLENKYLKTQVNKLESKVSDHDEVDEFLKQYPEMFSKISVGQYYYNNTKVNLFIENSALLCRVGNIMTVHDFLISFTHGSNSTTPCDISFKETTKHCQEVASEIGECSYMSEEDKKDEAKKKDFKGKQVLFKKQFKPEKKTFAPLRQTSAHFDRRKTK